MSPGTFYGCSLSFVGETATCFLQRRQPHALLGRERGVERANALSRDL